MQNRQAVAYASRALTLVQIEKELLTIVFACKTFEDYIYGHDKVHMKSDHTPLESIMLKLLNSTPKCLQRMLLKLQKYNLIVKYKGKENVDSGHP